MKITKTGILLSMFVVAFLGSIGTSFAASDFGFLVSTSPLWTDTGMILSPSNSYLVHGASGTVSWAG